MTRKKSSFGMNVNLGFGKSRSNKKSGDKKANRKREWEAYKRDLPKKYPELLIHHIDPRSWVKYLQTAHGRHRLLLTLLGFLGMLLILGVIRIVMIWNNIEQIISKGIDVSSTTNTYYDRNCIDDAGNIDANLPNCTVLWEDKGDSDYRLVVDGNEISPYAKMATVAIEDSRFYEHGGVDPLGILRAVFATIIGGDKQGGSTLTQQLVKQAFLTNDGVAARDGLAGIDRKFQEIVMSSIVETRYSKEQLLAMYMNYSPYGGNRNGIQSGARTYFEKDAKDLNITQSALLASIPNNPTQFNPYRVIPQCTEQATGSGDADNESVTGTIYGCTLVDNSLMIRERTTLKYMSEQCDNIKNVAIKHNDDSYNEIDCAALKTQIDNILADYTKFEEKGTQNEHYGIKINSDLTGVSPEINLLSTIKPQSDQMSSALAPHFVIMSRQKLEDELGVDVVGKGGFQIVTTLDYRVQKIIEEQVTEIFDNGFANRMGADNASAVMTDSQTGQILGLQGSRDYSYEGYGSVNSATSYLQPGSTIKPLVYSGLINKKEDPTFGAGSIIEDSAIPQCTENVSGICYTTANGKSVQNFSGKFSGPLPIRRALAQSLNIPAIRALYMQGYDNNGQPSAWNTIHAMGDESYCTDPGDANAGLSSAIGSCGVKQIEHTNAFATFMRGGTYKSTESIIKALDSKHQTQYWWEDHQKVEQAIDPQTAYILSDILSDPSVGLLGKAYNTNGVKLGGKSGTTDNGTGSAKDLWISEFSPKAVLTVWLGNHVPKGLSNAASSEAVAPALANKITQRAHLDVFEPDGTWHKNQWIEKPTEVKQLTINGKSDIFPSWYNDKQQTTKTQSMQFDKISRKLATDCTPEAAREEHDVVISYDPSSKKETRKAPDGWDADANDDRHSCGDEKPKVSAINPYNATKKTISAIVSLPRGGTVTFTIDGSTYTGVVSGNTATAPGTFNWPSDGKAHTITVSIIDDLFYSASLNKTITVGGGDDTE